MPSDLVAAAAREGRQDWLATLSRSIRHVAAEWSVEVGKPFRPGGQTAWVAPATRGSDDLVLKVLWRHPEAEHEADGLRVWGGNGAVHLHDVRELDADTIALLLERCRPGTPLKRMPEPEQDEVLAGLLLRLWIEPPAGHHFRTLDSMCGWWADEFERKTQNNPVLDPGLVRLGMTLFRELPASAERDVLLCTDLHAGNVLSAKREPWLLIDPKPYHGDPAYDALQHMLNCERRLHADPHGLARKMADLLGLDGDRLLLWLFARCVQESPEWPGLAEVARNLAPG